MINLWKSNTKLRLKHFYKYIDNTQKCKKYVKRKHGNICRTIL